MPYISLYRKYRPQTFEDVVGQDHITRTLKNAIREGRIASGYLFCGTRGTAKTTCARIFAKALNCIGPDGQAASPTPEPCGVCGPCRAVAASSFVDVIEMDAASHRGIDDMRDIVSAIKYPPMEGRYKVYIIDEAHQLTADAKDAFLKTLEEPPDRVLFILATTEQDKMPITIQSRCQVFEFKRGSVAQISKRVQEVLDAEHVAADQAAVENIARAADGSYRDSLSLLEQVLAYRRDKITAADVAIVLGTVDEVVLSRAVEVVAASDAAGAFSLVGEIFESGKDIRQLLKSLSGRFRELLYIRVGAASLAPDAALKAQAARLEPASLLRALEVITETERDLRFNPQQRLLLEMCLLRLMRLPASAPPIAAQSVPPPPPAQIERAQGAPTVERLPDIPPPLRVVEFEQDDDDLVAEDDDELGNDIPVAAPVETGPLFGHPDREVTISNPVSAWIQENDGNTSAKNPAPDGAELLTQLQQSWQEVINRVCSIRPAAGTLIKDARAILFNGQTFTLTLSNQFFVDRLNDNASGRKMIEDQINRTLSVPEDTYRVRGLLRDENGMTNASSAVPAHATKPAAKPAVPPQEHMDTLMDDVIAIFGGQIEDDETKG